MKVKIVYRNYKPLHSMYLSNIKFPPSNVVVVYQEPNKFLQKNTIFFSLYRKYSNLSLARTLISRIIDPILFSSNRNKDHVDLFHYINMIPNNKNQGPYIIEFEHIGGLLSFLFDEKKVKHVENALVSNDCRAVICSSKAAMMSLQKLIPKTYLKIQKKTQVVYPSLDREVMRLSIGGKKKKSKNYRILFVGNDSYRKGFEEIIIALLRIEKSILENIVMTVISNDADEILTKYNIPKYLRIKIHKPKFTKQDIIENFYAKNDVCILPTKQDTFGYAILDSLSTGTPVISSRQFAIPEIINSGYDGILVNITRSVLDENPIYKARDAELINSSNPDPVLIDEIQKVIINTYQNRHLLLEMSLHAKEKFLKGGKFSIEKRQKLMAAIYKKALKDA